MTSHRCLLDIETVLWCVNRGPFRSQNFVFLEGHVLLILFYPINLIVAYPLNKKKPELLAILKIEAQKLLNSCFMPSGHILAHSRVGASSSMLKSIDNA